MSTPAEPDWLDELLASCHQQGCPYKQTYGKCLSSGCHQKRKELKAAIEAKMAERERAARIDELKQLLFHGQGNDKQTVAGLYTHTLLRLKELQATQKAKEV